MNDPLGSSRYGVRVRYIEYHHVLLLLPSDLSAMFGLPWDEHVHWLIQDVPSEPEHQLDGETLVICVDDRNGSVLFEHRFIESYAEIDETDNNFYAIVMDYVRTTLGYDLGPLVVDINPPNPDLAETNALLQIEWTTFDD